jgi:hypothetical protein
LGNEHLHAPVNNDGRTYHQGLNTTPVKGSEYPQEKVQDYDVLPTNNKNLEPSYIQSTLEKLKETKGEMQFLGNSEQHGAENQVANLYELDLAKFMYTLVMLDRQNKSKLVYLEVNEVTKEVLHLYPRMALRIGKKKRQQKI